MKIAVIGAGLSGLVSVKECLQHGLEVVCFEESNVVGGLWHYRDDGSITVSRKTVTLTSKHLMAFSDFPMPDEYPVFLPNKFYLQYLLSYAKKYRLKDHVKFNTLVTSMAKNDDYEMTGRWSVTFVEQNKPCATETFDGVFVANGRYRKIYQPHFQGVEKFVGRLFSCQTFKNVRGFENRTTLVVGFGHTACETASALASVASQVYIASRQSEQWCASRTGLLGLPHDFLTETRFFHWLFTVLPRLYMVLLEFLTSLKFDRSTVIRCANKKLISNKTQVVSDELPFYISSGQVVVKPNVKKFTGGNEVQFEDGTTLDIEDVIFCTGYTQGPCILKQNEGKNSLYKLMYPIWDEDGTCKQHNTLCFVGMAAPRGALAPISEMQARFHCAVLTGFVRLPTYKDMEREILEFSGRESGLSQTEIRGLPYLDDLATRLGAKPKIWGYFFVDPLFAIKSLFLAAVPYQFRLQGHGAWSGAKDAMRRSWSRAGVLEKGRKISTVARLCRTNDGRKTDGKKETFQYLMEKVLTFLIRALMMITILCFFLLMVQYFL